MAKRPRQYVTVSFGGKSKGLYTYQNHGPWRRPGDTVWVRGVTGVRPVAVVATSRKAPSGKPSGAADGYKGPVPSRLLRTPRK